MPERNSGRPLRGLGKLFGDLKVRPKLMILHNLFFLTLAAAVYLSVIPPFQRRMANAEARETALATAIFARGSPPQGLRAIGIYEYEEGPARAIGVPPDVQGWLESHPGAIWKDAERPDYVYGRDPGTGIYRKARMPHAFYQAAMTHARWALLAVLALIYGMAVLLLEAIILPVYVYRPLKAMLEADEATQQEDHAHELIDERLISNDEFGQIMRSRNATISELRRHERNLAAALVRLEEAAQDLKRKNHEDQRQPSGLRARAYSGYAAGRDPSRDRGSMGSRRNRRKSSYGTIQKRSCKWGFSNRKYRPFSPGIRELTQERTGCDTIIR
jgi:hypothetical protein